MTGNTEATPQDQTAQKRQLDKSLDSIGWGLFLLMIGSLWLMPEGSVPEGAWLIGTGVIILGITLVRMLNALKISGFWVVLGILALGTGLADMQGLELPVFPILLIIVGAAIILKPLFGKGE